MLIFYSYRKYDERKIIKCTKYFIWFPFVSTHFLPKISSFKKRWISFYSHFTSPFGCCCHCCWYFIFAMCWLFSSYLFYDRMVLNFSYFAYLCRCQLFFFLLHFSRCFYFSSFSWNVQVLWTEPISTMEFSWVLWARKYIIQQ